MERRGLELRFMLRAAVRFAGAIPPWRFRKAFWQAAERMQSHGTDRTNYEVMIEALERHARRPVKEAARRFIEEDFPTLSDRFGPVPGARETLLLARRLGFRLVLATNPVWPLSAVRRRLEWGGVRDIPFDFIANSEVMTRSKPDPAYYFELLGRIGAKASECLMIGNDPRKDLPARELGIRTFLIGQDLSFAELRRWMEESCVQNHR